MQDHECNTGARMAKRTVLLAVIGVFVPLLLIVVGPVGASDQSRSPRPETSTSVVVSPAEGGPTNVFSISFTAPRTVKGNNWYLIEVKAPSKKRSCEYYESVEISSVAGGQRVDAQLRPYDRRHWCVGQY